MFKVGDIVKLKLKDHDWLYKIVNLFPNTHNRYKWHEGKKVPEWYGAEIVCIKPSAMIGGLPSRKLFFSIQYLEPVQVINELLPPLIDEQLEFIKQHSQNQELKQMPIILKCDYCGDQVYRLEYPDMINWGDKCPTCNKGIMCEKNN